MIFFFFLVSFKRTNFRRDTASFRVSLTRPIRDFPRQKKSRAKIRNSPTVCTGTQPVFGGEFQWVKDKKFTDATGGEAAVGVGGRERPHGWNYFVPPFHDVYIYFVKRVVAGETNYRARARAGSNVATPQVFFKVYVFFSTFSPRNTHYFPFEYIHTHIIILLCRRVYFITRTRAHYCRV